MVAVSALMQLLGAPLSGWCSRSPGVVLCFSITFLAIAHLSSYLLWNLWMCIVIAVCMGLSKSLYGHSVQGHVVLLESALERRDSARLLSSLRDQLGWALGAALAGLLGHMFSLKLMFLGASIVSFTLMICAALCGWATPLPGDSSEAKYTRLLVDEDASDEDDNDWLQAAMRSDRGLNKARYS